MAQNNPQKKSEDWARRWEQVRSLFQEVEKEIELAKNQGKMAKNPVINILGRRAVPLLWKL